MKKSELLESEWKKQLIHDLGLEKYNALHSKSDEGITIAPFYVANKTSFLKNRLLFPDDWNIITEINKKKYLVPKDMPMNQFVFIIRKRIKLDPSQSLFIMVNIVKGW